MRVSVVIPAYRSHAMIPRAIHSVLQQSVAVHEVIIVADDGGDYSGLSADRRVRCISSGGVASGPGNARNAGMDAAEGEVIALLDADDAFHPDRLQHLLPLVARYGAAFSAIRYLDHASGLPLPVMNAVFAKEALLPREHLLSGMHTQMHVLFHKERCPARYDFSRGLEDVVFAMKLYDYVEHIGYSALPLCDYYRHGDSICNQAGSAEKFLAFIDSLMDEHSGAHAQILRYRAYAPLMEYLAVMRRAEQAVLAGEVGSFQEIFLAMAKRELFPKVGL